MLGFMTSDVDVGYYNAAVKIKSILVSIVTSLGVVLLPRASYYVEHNLMEEFYRITKKATNFVFLVASPMMVYFIIFAKEGIFFLSGSAYAGSIVPMQIIIPTLLLIGLTNIMGIQMLVPLGREKTVLYSEDCRCYSRCNSECTFDSKICFRRSSNWNISRRGSSIDSPVCRIEK